MFTQQLKHTGITFARLARSMPQKRVVAALSNNLDISEPRTFSSSSILLDPEKKSWGGLALGIGYQVNQAFENYNNHKKAVITEKQAAAIERHTTAVKERLAMLSQLEQLISNLEDPKNRAIMSMLIQDIYGKAVTDQECANALQEIKAMLKTTVLVDAVVQGNEISHQTRKAEGESKKSFIEKLNDMIPKKGLVGFVVTVVLVLFNNGKTLNFWWQEAKKIKVLSEEITVGTQELKDIREKVSIEIKQEEKDLASSPKESPYNVSTVFKANSLDHSKPVGNNTQEPSGPDLGSD
ncbi:MAG: hypothetical protein K0Q57_180 [Gammaproteobacteria bacterium]|jgi:hypothetical protein|nr:hypothetical protein [Gammaproteobacteria bacterium]